MSRTISTIYKSLLRSVNELIKEVNNTTSVNDVEYHAWETRLDENKLPTTTLLGLDGYNFNENQGLWLVRFAITLSSYNDANLMNEAEILDVIHSMYGFEKKISIRDPDTGAIFTEMYVSDFEVMPMAQSELRNYRTIGFEILRTDSGDF